MTRLLTIMGSGETAPTMVKPHREVFERLATTDGDPRAEIPAVIIDTPFGFQENADELALKAVEYFRVSLNRPVGVAGLRRIDTATALERESAFSAIRQARFLFAGPGSPTYALRQWAGSPVHDLLADKLATGGAVTFASAAALTLGVRTVPVYEIYKSGADPHWLDGLDLLSAIGLPVAVIPHYNNAEGGHHDTRFCYMGERRLRMLEEQLPPGAFVLGVDEHTGVVLDLDADTARVVGLGVVTVRRAGQSMEIRSGETVPIDVLRDGPRPATAAADRRAGTAVESPTDGVAAPTPDTTAPSGGASLADDAHRLAARFDDAITRRDADAAVAAVLDLDDAITAWSTDSLQSDQMERARSLRRSMIVRLGAAAAHGLADPRAVLAPVVEVALAARREVRAAKRYDLSDQIRDGLAAAGVEVRDTAEGQVWELRPPA
jgi:cyanophycinase-like exopeptidase